MNINVKTMGHSVKDIKPFYLTPKGVNGSTSSVNSLRQNYGVLKDGCNTFKTGVISTLSELKFHNNRLILVVGEKNVLLIVNTVNESKIEGIWTLNSLTKELKRKNPQLVGITKSVVKSLITNGELVVKFNVVKKDHGTLWSINKSNNTPVVTKQVVSKDNFVMIPRNLYYKLFLLGQFTQPSTNRLF